MKTHAFYTTDHWQYPRVILRSGDEWGIVTADLGKPPSRLLPASHLVDAPVEQGVDSNRLTPIPTPAETLLRIQDDANVAAIGRKSLARLMAYFLVCEDPQRRFDSREVSTLAHQVSLVRHVLDNEHLRRVLIADEVGLGKTVEAGLLIQELIAKQPGLRIIYFAPARLVSNVRREFDRLSLGFRQWSSQQADARLDDPRLIVSIHRAVHKAHRDAILETEPWDVIVVDECHHLSDWAEGGGDPREKFRLVRDLIKRQNASGRIVLLSGTPHQGHVSRFENLVRLLKGPNESESALNGRVIFRTKDDIVDWEGRLLFPRRVVNPPLVVDLGEAYKLWVSAIHDYFCPPRFSPFEESTPRQRAAGWRCAQAMQWAASSPQAGLGYLVRQAIRLGADLHNKVLSSCLEQLRPYRNGAANEQLPSLFERIKNEVRRQSLDQDIDDIEENADAADDGDLDKLIEILSQGLAVFKQQANVKWDFIRANIIDKSNGEKIVFFAQPIETVKSFETYLRKTFGEDVAVIIGGQNDAERAAEVDKFLRSNGPRFLVSSRAGGEGINLQIARRIVHIDVPWNPMDMEQRVGRVHRFGSRRNIIVDTVVVRDSREECAYRAAREKLRLIASTMVDKDRFESLFSRVICLVPPEELQHLLIDGDVGPLSKQNEEELGRMVQEGFDKWREFDAKYAEEQKRIRNQTAGLLAWKDVENFLLQYGRANPVPDFFTERFSVTSDETKAVQNVAKVVKLPDDSLVACDDLGGLPAYGPGQEVAVQFGLNTPAISLLINNLAFPSGDVGVSFLRWPKNVPLRLMEGSAFGILVFYRGTFRTDELRGWTEHATELRFFSVSENETVEWDKNAQRVFWDGINQATVRAKKPKHDLLFERIRDAETSIAADLRRPSSEELTARKRHAVGALLACIIEVE